MLLLGFHIKLLEIRKWVYSLLLLVIGLVTPPDIVSLILIWVPLIVMLEFGYYLSVVKMKIGLNPQSFLWCLYLTV
jgi:sec-independent protein translocase protein TatC